MDGLHIFGKKSPEKHTNHIDYHFDELISPISHLITDYHWLLNQVIFNHVAYDGDTFDDYENKYDKIIIQTEETFHIELTAKGFLNKYAKFIQGDWDAIYGLRNPINIKDLIKYKRILWWNRKILNIDKTFIENNSEIYFSCVDAAYWEIYSKNEEILNIFAEKFPNHQRINLNNNKY